MKPADIEWSILRGALIMLGVCLLMNIGLVQGSDYFKQTRQTQYNKNNSSFLGISRRYLAVDQEEQLINQYYSEFVQAGNNGLIGEEHRLNWIETLRRSDEKIKFPSLGYEILSRQEFIPEFQVDSGPYRFYFSEMNLKAGLLHEGDLLELLDYLDKHAEGAYSVSECQFRRLEQEINESASDKPNISLECVLKWITLDLADGGKLELL